MKTVRIIPFLLNLVCFLSAFGQEERVSRFNTDVWTIEENRGQLLPGPGGSPMYFANAPGAGIRFYPGHVTFLFPGEKGAAAKEVKLEFQNANPVAPAGHNKVQYRTHYYLAHTPNGITNVWNYNAVLYQELYPAIDLVFKIHSEGLKYEFVVRPGGDPADIRMRWIGIDRIDKAGTTLTCAFGEDYIEDSGLKSIGEDGNTVLSSFSIHENEVGFSIPEWDKSKSLIIDPTLKWSRYYGGNGTFMYAGEMWGNGGNRIDRVKTDKEGNIYILGIMGTKEDYEIVTHGPVWDSLFVFDSSFCCRNGGHPGFIGKFDSLGNRIWGMYVQNWLRDFDLDDSCNIYATGIAFMEQSQGIVTGGAHQTAVKGKNDMYLIKFDSSGTRKWGTFFGGTGGESAERVGIKNSSIYLVGSGGNSPGMTTKNAFDTTHNGSSDLVIVKFTVAGKLEWATYFGGNEYEYPYELSLDESENLYIVGRVASAGLATSNAYLTIIKATQESGFLLKFDSKGRRKWFTYYYTPGVYSGGSSTNVNASPDGNIRVIGGLPASSTWKAGVSMSCFDSLGSHKWSRTFNYNDTIYGSYYPANSFDYQGNVLIAFSHLSSTGNFITSDAVQKTGTSASFYAVFNSNARHLYGSYFGYLSPNGASRDHLKSTVFYKTNIYLAGNATYKSKIHTADAQDTVSMSTDASDAILMRTTFEYSTDHAVHKGKEPFTRTCQYFPAKIPFRLSNPGTMRADSIKIFFKIDDSLIAPVMWRGILLSGSDSMEILHLGPDNLKPGYHKVKIWVSDNNKANDTAIVTILIDARPPSLVGESSEICFGDSTVLGTSHSKDYKYYWQDGDSVLVDTVANPMVAPGKTTKYTLIQTYIPTGCKTIDSVLVAVNPLPESKVGTDKTICFGDSVQLGETPATQYFYKWNSASESSTLSQPVFTPKKTTVYHLTLTDAVTGCISKDSVKVTVNPLPLTFPISGLSKLCEGSNTWYKTKRDNQKNTLQWEIQNGTLLTNSSVDSVLVSWDVGEGFIQAVQTTELGCIDSISLKTEIGKVVKASFTVNDGCVNTPVSFTNTTSGEAKFLWNFGSLSTDTAKSPSFNFATSGKYDVKLSATTADGCTHSISRTVNIYEFPNVNWKLTDLGGGRIEFSTLNTSEKYYMWYFGTGDSAAGSNTTYTYPTNGDYPVKLVVRNHAGCEVVKDTLLQIGNVGISDFFAGDILKISPNPCFSALSVTFAESQTSEVHFELFTPQGKLVRRFETTPSAYSGQVLKLDLASLPSGVYLLALKSENKILQFYRVIKM